ncbi:MAG TPA: hypothetical protein VKW77_08840, partial [Acidimicrobiales bacterium]|nr:hypothetical protein [Acidimicrobiales bacterium]
MAIASVPEGSYRFLAAPGRPFSSGVIADEGFDLVRAVLLRPLPLEEGLEAARRQLEAADRPISAICGLELRSPRPLSRPEFDGFNAAYVRLLRAMGLTEGADPPAARTNVVPAFKGPSAPSLYAFSYTVPGHRPEPGFRLSGVAETRPEATPEDRLRSIVETLEARMAELGVGWESAT